MPQESVMGPWYRGDRGQIIKRGKEGQVEDDTRLLVVERRREHVREEKVPIMANACEAQEPLRDHSVIEQLPLMYVHEALV